METGFKFLLEKHQGANSDTTQTCSAAESGSCIFLYVCQTKPSRNKRFETKHCVFSPHLAVFGWSLKTHRPKAATQNSNNELYYITNQWTNGMTGTKYSAIYVSQWTNNYRYAYYCCLSGPYLIDMGTPWGQSKKKVINLQHNCDQMQYWEM